MVTLDDIKQPIAPQLEEFNDFVRRSFNEKEGTLLADMLDYVLSSRGKGLRPIITMLAAGLCSPSGNFGKRTMVAAMLAEMIHVASLVHDDVIDESNLRRGRPSVNARWQSRNAVLVGDYILARTVEVGIRSGQFDLLNLVVGGMATLCDGEITQSDHANRLDVTRADYFEIIYKKTAHLFAICASAGAMSVSASPEKVAAMRTFGKMLGMAFQIVDDILDYIPDNNAGKPVANDLRERKITLPLIEVLERLSDEERAEIKRQVALCAESDEAMAFVQAKVEEHHGVELARETMRQFLQRAMSELAAFDESASREALLSLCTFVAERDR